ncbi:hypothetical protein FB45DRAFT_876956 [Roridomyces roridus]|uniref:Uncharacterized protein n=1 Tax=Roridomyces roridus TaxID=1738132 RepID=A0AAD7FAE1_9AGAR|nr:hypothetical protein FB45DRAFT_876956 [Roridomyces roridus]
MSEGVAPSIVPPIPVVVTPVPVLLPIVPPIPVVLTPLHTQPVVDTQPIIEMPLPPVPEQPTGPNDEDVDLGAVSPQLPPNTHARHNPDRPVIPTHARYRKPKEKNSAQLTRLRRQMRANKSQAIADDVRDIRKAVEESLPAIAARHGMAVKELRRRVYNGAAIKNKREINCYNAKVCCVMETLNEDREYGNRYMMKQTKKMIAADRSLLVEIDPEQLERMVIKLEADRVIKRTGVRGDNIAATADAQRSLAVIAELIKSLYHRTGVLGFAFFSGADHNNSLPPVALQSGDALKFCSEILFREPELINTMLNLWAIQRNAGAISALSTERMRALGSAMIKSGLIQVTGKPNVVMNFEGYVKSIVRAKHVALLGWPAGVPWKRCGKQTQADDVRAIYKALKDGDCKWVKLKTEKEEDEEERHFTKLVKNGMAPAPVKRKVRKDFQGTHEKRDNTGARYVGSDSDDQGHENGDGEGSDGDDLDHENGDEEGQGNGEGEGSDEELPFADYNGAYSDDGVRKKAKSKSTTKKLGAKSSAKSSKPAAAAKSSKPVAKPATKKPGTKSAAKPAPKPAKPAPKPAKPAPKPTKPATKPTKPTPFVPTSTPPPYVRKGAKFVPNRAAVDAHGREMAAARARHEREAREARGGSDGDDDSQEEVDEPLPLKKAPIPRKKRATAESDAEEGAPVKKRPRTNSKEKRAREGSEDEDEQPAAKKTKVSVEVRPRPAWNSAERVVRPGGIKTGPPIGVRKGA